MAGIIGHEIAPHRTRPASEREDGRARSRSWLSAVLVFGALAVGALGFLWGSRSRDPAPRSLASETTLTGATTTAEPSVSARQLDALFARSDVPDRTTLSGVVFGLGKTIPSDGTATVERIAALMKTHPDTRIRLEGHTDDVGNADLNDKLARARAESVRTMLIEQGVASQRIEAVGRRDFEPVSSNDTTEGREQNRRVELVIVAR